MQNILENLIAESKEKFWNSLDKLIETKGIEIDRPKGTAHPRFPDLIYKVDYGFIPGTQASDKQGIDIFRGRNENLKTTGILCTLDSIKLDSEIKILYQCTDEDIELILTMLNDPPLHRMLIRR